MDMETDMDRVVARDDALAATELSQCTPRDLARIQRQCVAHIDRILSVGGSSCYEIFDLPPTTATPEEITLRYRFILKQMRNCPGIDRAMAVAACEVASAAYFVTMRSEPSTREVVRGAAAMMDEFEEREELKRRQKEELKSKAEHWLGQLYPEAEADRNRLLGKISDILKGWEAELDKSPETKGRQIKELVEADMEADKQEEMARQRETQREEEMQIRQEEIREVMEAAAKMEQGEVKTEESTEEKEEKKEGSSALP
ncbi:hypothetical protein QBC46DRAFT_435422 [Diplogelasinospora grovesii]|uniref:Uncharacterized protein n=1 Tax=Diplogelasinospora grovesii TaxID=303347 RepID=A0AAN6N8H3_9PEZI|nr:hypothetical protein QBC46DRAFT_435422 [Diplogelasinospora grovesii]